MAEAPGSGPPTMEKIVSMLEAHDARLTAHDQHLSHVHNEVMGKLNAWEDHSKDESDHYDHHGHKEHGMKVEDFINVNPGGQGLGGAGMLPFMMNNGWGNSGALGAGALGFVAGALIGNRRGGLLGGEGGGDGCGPALLLQDKLGDIQSNIATTASQTQIATAAGLADVNLSTANQTTQILSAIGSAKDTTQNAGTILLNAINGVNQGICQEFGNLALQQANQTSTLLGANANTKDAVTSSGVVLLQSLNTLGQNLAESLCDVKATVIAEGCATRGVVQAEAASIRDLINQNTIADLNARLAQVEHRSHSEGIRIGISNELTNQQAQAQAQAQGINLLERFNQLSNQILILGNQVNNQGQTLVALNSTLAGSGQANTGVNTR